MDSFGEYRKKSENGFFLIIFETILAVSQILSGSVMVK